MSGGNSGISICAPDDQSISEKKHMIIIGETIIQLDSKKTDKWNTEIRFSLNSATILFLLFFFFKARYRKQQH